MWRYNEMCMPETGVASYKYTYVTVGVVVVNWGA